MARLKSPLASGEVINRLISNSPADWPATVTLSGSPPNWRMFSRTQRGDLVHQPIVSRSLVRRFVSEFRMHQEAQRSQTVIDGDQHQSAAHQRALIEAGRLAGAGGIGTSVDQIGRAS